MPFQANLDHVHLARGFFPSPEIYAAARPFLARMMCLDPAERISAARDAAAAMRAGNFPALPATRTMGNHYHDSYSWSRDGFRVFPAASAYISKLSGEVVTGQVNHYSMYGAAEFRSACRIFGIPYTTGYEIRGWQRNPLVLNGHDLSQEVVNAPGFPGMMYFVFHSVINDTNPFLEAAIPAKLKRYAATTDLINDAFAARHIKPLSFGRIVESSLFGNVLDKHVLGECFDVLFDHFGGGGVSFDKRVEKMIGFIAELSKKDIDQAKLLESAHKYNDDQDREYAVFSTVIDYLRSRLLSVGSLAFIMPDEAECPSLERLADIAAYDNSLLTYPILLMSAKGGEDPYLLKFLDHLVKKLKFFSVSWMPNRNSPEESKMIMRETLARMILAISGMDVNKYLQRWIEAASADPWLIETALALVGHEAALRSSYPGINCSTYDSLLFKQRIAAFSSLGQLMDLETGKVTRQNLDQAILAARSR